jgi:hypothetical protein
MNVSRAVDALRARVHEALDNAIDNDYFHGEYDAEGWAEDLQFYCSDLEEVDVASLAFLVQEHMDRRAVLSGEEP